MPQGDKSSYTDKQKRQVKHIEEGYEKKGVGKKEAERRAWATENKISGAGKRARRPDPLHNPVFGACNCAIGRSIASTFSAQQPGNRPVRLIRIPQCRRARAALRQAEAQLPPS